MRSLIRNFVGGAALEQELPARAARTGRRVNGAPAAAEPGSGGDRPAATGTGSPANDEAGGIIEFGGVRFTDREIEQTIDDPKAYTRPFTTRLTWRLMPDTEIMEMICLENNQSIHHLVGADGPVKKP